MLVDKHANRQNRPPEYVQESFYGQLLHILVVHLPAALELHPHLSKSSTYLLAAVHQCEVTQKGPLKTPIYSKMGCTEVVDINCVQCLVGRVRVGRDWAIIDRTSHVQQSGHVQDE